HPFLARNGRRWLAGRRLTGQGLLWNTAEPLTPRCERLGPPMSNNLKSYIDGAWVDPVATKTLAVIDLATEEAYPESSLGSAADVDKAVAAARKAFASFTRTTREERLALLRRILEVYNKRIEDIAQAVSDEMGAPISLARNSQATIGQAHLQSTIKALESFEF